MEEIVEESNEIDKEIKKRVRRKNINNNSIEYS